MEAVSGRRILLLTSGWRHCSQHLPTRHRPAAQQVCARHHYRERCASSHLIGRFPVPTSFLLSVIHSPLPHCGELVGRQLMLGEPQAGKGSGCYRSLASVSAELPGARRARSGGGGLAEACSASVVRGLSTRRGHAPSLSFSDCVGHWPNFLSVKSSLVTRYRVTVVSDQSAVQWVNISNDRLLRCGNRVIRNKYLSKLDLDI